MTTTLTRFDAPTISAEDHIAMTVAKQRLIREIQTSMPNVRIVTLEDQAASYRRYAEDLAKCRSACLDFLVAYTEIVKAIGSDDSDADRGTLADVVNDWSDDELFVAEEWADRIEQGEDDD